MLQLHRRCIHYAAITRLLVHHVSMFLELRLFPASWQSMSCIGGRH